VAEEVREDRGGRGGRRSGSEGWRNIFVRDRKGEVDAVLLGEEQ